MDRDLLLVALRERNAAYEEPVSVMDELVVLSRDVERLRRQVHVLERSMLQQNEALAEDKDQGVLKDPLRLSPALWSRLAFGMLQSLSKSDPPDFHAAVLHVCAESSKHVANAGDEVAAEEAVAEPGVPRPDTGSAPQLEQTKLSTAEVLNQFCTHVVQGMLAEGGQVDHARLQGHVGRFKALLLEACWGEAGEEVPVSEALAAQDRREEGGGGGWGRGGGWGCRWGSWKWRSGCRRRS